jgi:class 3 adenylate cyclase
VAFAHALRRELAEIDLRIRCGVHTGEIELREAGDISGTAVNLAARVEQTADDGAIFVSSTVRDMLLGGDIQFEDRGEHALKGFDSPWRLYALVDSS